MDRYFSKTYTTEEGGDLMTQIRADLEGKFDTSTIRAKRLTLLSATSIGIDINHVGYSEMFEEIADTRYSIYINYGEVLISSIVTQQGSESIYVAIIF